MFARLLLDLLSGSGEQARLTTLAFHRVAPKPDPLFPAEMHAERFDALMAHVSRRFNVLPLADAIDRLVQGRLPSRALAVTFDDGYADNLSVAAPILRRHGIPATVFVATDYLDGGCMWNDIVIEACRRTHADQIDCAFAGVGVRPTVTAEQRSATATELLAALKYRAFDEREALARQVADAAGIAVPDDLMLSRRSLAELKGDGIDIGAHTRRHPILVRLSDDEAWTEIEGSRRDLAELLGKPVALFAYPNGKAGSDYAPTHVRMAREAGYRAALTTEWGIATRTTDLYAMPRFTPWRTDPLGFDLQLARNLRVATA